MTDATVVEAREVLLALAERCEKATGADNALDVEIEVALWEPGNGSTGARANDAGTKVIYSFADGSEKTFWAEEWTSDRLGVAAALRARATLDGSRADG